MSGRKRIYLRIGLFLIGLLGLWGCGSPSSDSGQQIAMESEPKTELVYEGSMDLSYAAKFPGDYYEGGYNLLTATMDVAK